MIYHDYILINNPGIGALAGIVGLDNTKEKINSSHEFRIAIDLSLEHPQMIDDPAVRRELEAFIKNVNGFGGAKRYRGELNKLRETGKIAWPIKDIHPNRDLQINNETRESRVRWQKKSK